MKKAITLLFYYTIIYLSGTNSLNVNNKVNDYESGTIKPKLSTNLTEDINDSNKTVPIVSKKKSTSVNVTSTPDLLTDTQAFVTNTPTAEIKTTNSMISTTVIPTTDLPKITTDASKVTVEPQKKIFYIPLESKPYKWVVNGTNSSIIVQMSAKLNIVYQNSTTKKNVSVEIVVPANNDTQLNGNFTQTDETLKLSWKSSGTEQNYVLFHFKRFMNTYALNDLEVSIDSNDIPNGSNSSLKLVHGHKHFNTSIGNSYRCIRLQTFNLTQPNDTAVVGYMKVTDLQFEAFKTDKKATFSLAEDCAFDTPDVVPIAVGCVLAGLVIIVLAAYLISRRRSDARGYLSM